MSASAWWMLILTWTAVFGFTGRFLWLVLTLPPRRETEPAPPPADGGEP